MTLVSLDGREVRVAHEETTEVIVVGSGPAGATVARQLSAKGLRVTVVEEGHEARAASPSGLEAMAELYRDMGTSIALGNASMPYLQGRVVGGTSVINGAISWQLPREAVDAWLQRDPALAPALDWAALQSAEAWVLERLQVSPTDEAIAGEKNRLLGRGAEVLGVAHRPIQRNVVGCRGSGRCLQGCPHGAKLSMDRTLLPDAVKTGAHIIGGARVERVMVEKHRAVGVRGTFAGGGAFTLRATHAVVLAASAIQTPVLLLASGLTQGPVGRHLTAHPGVSVTGRFAQPVRNWEGATQGHEVTGYRSEGLKLEALGFDLSILASRVPGMGAGFAQRLRELGNYAVWGAAMKARAEGRVRRGWRRPLVTYSLTPEDVRLARRGVRVLGDTLLAAGATEVYPGVPGFDPVVTTRERMAQLEELGSLNARDYTMSMTHLFGTARMGSDTATSVVRPDFRHHRADALYVADSSIFPGNLGVNPQISIMVLADRCAASIAAR